MADASTIIEGAIKYRDGKKWKPRWCIVRKLSPVADCLHLQLYRDCKDRGKHGPTKASLSLEGFLGVESGFTLDKESNTLAIICKDLVVVTAFESREMLIEWQVKIHTNLGEDQQFSVELAHVPPKSRTPLGPSHLHIIDGSFCLTSGLPPRLLGNWQLAELRRYGVVSGKFCFEGGSRCGRGEGLHVLISNQPEQISSAYDLASQGKLSVMRRPFVRKNSVIGNAAHRTPTKEHWASTTTVCSAESSRPLLNSSDSSTCDGSAEATVMPLPLAIPMRPSEGIIGPASCSDEQKENYRWPSQGSNDGKTSVTSADLDSVDTMSIAISDIPENAGCGNGGMTPTWVGSCHEGHKDCATLGRNGLMEHCAYCSDCGDSVFGSSWVNGNKKYPHVRDNFNSELSANGAKHDSMSVSSHGSTSSSGSGGTNASEYSMPRILAESLYDRPRSILPHACCFKNGQANQAADIQNSHGMAKDFQRQKGHQTLQFPHRCTNNNGATLHEKSNGNLPNVHQPATSSMTLPHPSKIHHCYDFSHATTPSTTTISSHKYDSTQAGCPCSRSQIRKHCHSPTTSPSRKSSARRADKIRASSGTNQPICLCQTNPPHLISGLINPYGNYDVPRSALCPTLHKDAFSSVRSVSQSATENNRTKRASTVSSDGSEYDVPRRIKDCLHAEESVIRTSSENMRPSSQIHGIGQPMPLQTHLFHPCESRLHQCRSESQEPMQSCACQRVMHWAENLLVCRRQKGFSDDKLDSTSTARTLPINQQMFGSDAHCTYHHQLDLNCDTTMRHLVEAKIGSDGDSVVQIIQHCTCTHVHTLPPFKTSGITTSLPRPAASLPNDLTCAAAAPNQSHSLVYANNYQEHLPEKQFENKLSEIGLVEKVPCKMPASVICDHSDYANLEFLKSLEMYENSAAVLARLEQMNNASENVIYTQPDPVSAEIGHQGVYNCTHCNHSWSSCGLENPPPTDSKSSDCIEDCKLTVSSDVDSNNYLMMQPCSEPQQRVKLPLNSSAKHPAKCPLVDHRHLPTENEVQPCVELPLKPFMPLVLSKSWQVPRKGGYGNCEIEDGTDVIIASPTIPAIKNLNTEGLRTTRSNSVVEFKRRVFLRKRSSSADSRQVTNPALSAGIDNCEFSRESGSGHCRNISKEEWPSAEDIAKAIDGRVNSECTIKCHLNGRSCSQECSEECVEQKLCVPANCSVIRSSIVPCKSANRDSASSSDSGVSTSSPKQSVIGNNGGSEEVGKHYVEVDVTNIGEGSNEIPDQLLGQLCSVDSKSTTSSTMSDMSDYIETLSLSSHGSGDSQDLYRPHGSATNTLRPRSCKEYQKVDRNTLSELSSSLTMMSTTNGGRVVTMDCSGGVSQKAYRTLSQTSNPSSASSSVCTSPTKLPSQSCAVGALPVRIPVRANLEKET